MPARARLFVFSSLIAGLSACGRAAPPAPPPPPWLVEVASIEGDGGAGLTRCGGAACEHVQERALLGAGAALRADRGARVTLALDEGTVLSFRDGAEIEIAEAAPRTVRVKRGAVTVERKGDAPSAIEPVIIEASGRGVVVSEGPLAAAVRAGAEDEPSSAMIRRGRAALRGEGGERVLATGEGARWTAGEAPAPLARWMTPDDDATEAPAAPRGSAPRGLGTMTARVPGTNDVVSGVRLAMHHVTAEVQDGFARTVVEEEFENETSRTLEGKFVFPLPPDASISRLALYVGDELMEGEVVERPLAARVFRAIVDDTVRPRDPAILEQGSGSTVSLKIFPIPAKGKRRVILAYDQALSGRGEHVRYVYPLSLGADRATPIDDFSLSVVVKDSAAALGSAMAAGYDASLRADEQGIVASYSAKRFAPSTDFVLRYTRTESAAASLSWSPGPKGAPSRDGEQAAGYFAVRLRAAANGAAARASHAARAFVMDASHSQSAETLDAAIQVVKAALAGLDPEDRFTVLACDSACVSYPEDGLARAGDDAIAGAASWMAKRAPAGSSDLAGALLDAASRLSEAGGGQVVYLGDGVATSGELGLAAITGRVRPGLRGLDAHFVGVGPSVDEAALSALAHAVSGTYERLATGDALAARAAEIARTLDAPVLRGARLVLPEGAFDVHPAKLPPLRLGQELQVFGRFRPKAQEPQGDTVPAALRPEDEARHGRGPLREVRLSGEVDGEPHEIVRSLDWDRALAAPSPAVHALWARSKIRALEIEGGPEATKEIVRLSTVHHVLSRSTALLVLENERMFVETGVRAAIERVLASEPQGAKPSGVASGGASSAPGGAPAAASPRPTEGWGMTGLLSAPSSAQGNLWGDSGGNAFGAGGLGLSGIGEGGGGRGEGIGLGSIGTIGHGASSGVGVGFGSGIGRLSGSHKTSSPRVRGGSTSVSGRLPPEVIQRIVRQNFGRFRLCYEDGLRRNPELQGRVAVRFVIDRTGAATSVGNGGSDMPDSAVVSCVVRAFLGLRFPEPEGGIVTVVYPILFSPPDDSSPMSSSSSSWKSSRSSMSSWPSWAPNPVADGPSVTHRSPDDVAASNDGAIAKLLAQVADPAAPRSAHQSLVKKLLAAGRFDDAFTAASRYRGLDPDHEAALELYAQAAAATGRAGVALTAVDAQVEADPTQAAPHRRAAAAFEAAGDERRACAHFRALASLPSADDGAVYHALRCRARLGERQGALAEARALSKPGPPVTKLVAALEAGSAPPYEPAAPAGSFEVRVACSGEGADCPVPVVVGPTGTVVSPWTPAAPCTRTALALTNVRSGTYRTILAGDVPPSGAEITVRALGQSKTLTVTQPGTRVVLASTVTMPQSSVLF